SLSGGEQAHLIVGHLTIPRAHPEFAALELLGVILGTGSGLSGRIPRRVREREGLAYSVETGVTAGAGLDPGRLFVHLGTSLELLERAERCVREELERLVEVGPSSQEVEEARSYLIGREPFRREAPHQVAELAAAAELYGLPIDDPEWVIQRWRSADRDEVASVAKRHLRPDALRITVGRPNS
ncbi:MAG: insulinase family protein, partial [Thermoanaerobaculia bacterium]